MAHFYRLKSWIPAPLLIFGIVFVLGVSVGAPAVVVAQDSGQDSEAGPEDAGGDEGKEDTPPSDEPTPSVEPVPEYYGEPLPKNRPGVDLTIWDGLAYGKTPPVSENDEENRRGAISCANMNDFSYSDHADDPKADLSAIDLDLMPLLIRFSPDPADTNPQLVLTHSGGADMKLWKDRSKKVLFNKRSLTPDDVGAGLWVFVEKVKISSKVRGDFVNATYTFNGTATTDTVLLTFYWIEREIFRSSGGPSSRPFPDLDDQILSAYWKSRAYFDSRFGHYQLNFAAAPPGKRDEILFSYQKVRVGSYFKITPPNVDSIQGVVFDVTRQADTRLYYQSKVGGPWTEDTTAHKDFVKELPNDSNIWPENYTSKGDRDSNPLNDHIGNVDAPGFTGVNSGQNFAYFLGNMRDFVRVRYNGAKFPVTVLDTTWNAAWTRGSEFSNWHFGIGVKAVPVKTELRINGKMTTVVVSGYTVDDTARPSAADPSVMVTNDTFVKPGHLTKDRTPFKTK